MKTLVTNASANYLKQGTVPRVFVSIPDANLFLGQQAYTETAGLKKTYTNSIKSSGTITQTIEPFGGMGQVSGVSVSNLELADDVSFSTTCDISPLGTPGSLGAGRTVSEGVADADYSGTTGIRNVVSGVFDTGAITVGQRYSIGSLEYSVYRGCLQFTIPDMTSLEDATLVLTGLAGTNVNFGIELYEGSWLSWEAGSIYSQFDGRSGVAAYTTGVELNESWRTEQFSTTSSNYIRFNSDGRAAILADAGSTFKLVLLSKKDVDNTAPNEDEYVRFSSNDAVLRLRYNTKSLFNQIATIYLGFAATGNSLSSLTSTSDSMQKIWTGVIDDWTIDDSTLDLSLRQNNFKKDILIPQGTITLDDFPNTPSENVGLVIPSVYGAAFPASIGKHEMGVGKEGSGVAVDVLSGLKRYFKAPTINVGDNDYENPTEVLISNREIKDTIGSVTFTAQWSESLASYTRLWADPSSDIEDTFVSLKLYPKTRIDELKTGTVGEVVTTMDFLGSCVSVIPNSVFYTTGVTNTTDAYSGTASESAIISSNDNYAQYGFPKIGSGGLIETAQMVFNLTDNNVPANGTNTLTLNVYDKPDDITISGDDGFTILANQFLFETAGSTDFHLASVGDTLVIGAGDINVGRYGITQIGGANSTWVRVFYNGPFEVATNQSFKVFAEPSSPVLTSTPIYGTGQRIINIPTTDIDWNVENKLVEFKYNRLDSSSGTGTIEISNVQLRIFHVEDQKFLNGYFDKEGNQDDASGSISGTPDLMLDNPGHVMNFMAQNDMEYNSTDISFASGEGLDAIATSLGGTGSDRWQMSFQLDDREKGSLILNNLGEQSKTKLFYDERDRLSGVTFSTTNAFPNQTDTDIPFVPTDLDIFQDSDSVASGSFTRHSMLHSKFSQGSVSDFKIEHMGMDEVKNDFTLHYQFDEGRDDFTQTLYMTNGSGSTANTATNMTEGSLERNQTLTVLQRKCADSFNDVNTTNKWEFDATLIRDDATANKLLQHYIERLTKNRMLCTFTVGLSGLAHEVGDFINIRHDRLKDLIGTATMNTKKWEIQEINTSLSDFTITIKAMEV